MYVKPSRGSVPIIPTGGRHKNSSVERDSIYTAERDDIPILICQWLSRIPWIIFIYPCDPLESVSQNPAQPPSWFLLSRTPHPPKRASGRRSGLSPGTSCEEVSDSVFNSCKRTHPSPSQAIPAKTASVVATPNVSIIGTTPVVTHATNSARNALRYSRSVPVPTHRRGTALTSSQP